ncbi:LOW QUALITY PROTEIN: hypothetical protein RJ640_016584 [Escallonia rubra]|uniref:Uncharacterized protein n=1 Tax=Escallonia rubra TaxID=112253 RepID=A0AA88RKE8_9ASTE|nr:LOW QUALITY PROTEIN: hypothetical protein RJ640_016584 [Escallonia rubra]
MSQHQRDEIETDFTKLLSQARESELMELFFNELEQEYADHYRKVLKRKAWHIGPLSLCNIENEDKAERGKKAVIDENECLKWLDAKKPNSVTYICFGSVVKFTNAQLYEMAMGLEASGQQFIWVVRRGKNEESEKWLPEGFEERLEGRGLIIRGWAPQVLILDHEAVGGFWKVCVLEPGVPMVTWPAFADQFYNEKLVTEILRIGVPVGAKEWNRSANEGIKREAVENAVKQIMVGEEARERRSRAKELKEMARKAVEDGGSSYTDLTALIEDLKKTSSSFSSISLFLISPLSVIAFEGLLLTAKPNMGQLHVVFFPLMAHGHMIPALDMAKLFASRGLKTTIITTHLNAPVFSKTVERSKSLGMEMGLRVIKFPTVEAGLPEGCESADQLTSDDLLSKFIQALSMLEEQLEQVLQECRPNCLVADMFFPWATDVAAKFDIPRLVFHGTSFFALCAMESLRIHKPYKNVSSDSEPFVLPDLPHEIKLIKKQVSEFLTEEPETQFSKLSSQMSESELRSYGVVVNSFYELEPDYADHYREVLKRKAWHIGPILLCNRSAEDKAERGKKASVDEDDCLKWLDSKKPNSVLYVCFGSMATFTTSQLYEMAMGLEASEQQFIWVVRRGKEEEEEEKWLPGGFEERVKDRGWILRGWAPQVLILNHEAVGGFVTHCGWNSTLEGVCAGVPMVTWPVFGEQFYNEKLITDVLRTGVAIGSKEWNRLTSDGVKREAIENAAKQIMVGSEAAKGRARAKELKEKARQAVEEGGSSYYDLNALFEALRSYRS